MAVSRSSTVLLVDDNINTSVPLLSGLQDQGFQTLHASDGRQGLEYARAAQPDLVLLEAMLPRMDGFEVCRTLRQESVVPIIMLSANGHAEDRIRGLELGADDVLARPFSFRELLARMRALFRRRELDRRQLCPARDQIRVGDVVLDRLNQQVWRAGRLVQMPQREFDLLRLLMENAGQTVPRRELLDQVWGEGWIGYPRTLNVHIYRLRTKLEDDCSAPRYIQTVRSYGYRFAVPATSPAEGTRQQPVPI